MRTGTTRAGDASRTGRARAFAGASIVLALALAALAGCNRKPAAEGDGPVTITFWHFWRQAYMEPIIAAFEQANPGHPGRGRAAHLAGRAGEDPGGDRRRQRAGSLRARVDLAPALRRRGRARSISPRSRIRSAASSATGRRPTRGRPRVRAAVGGRHARPLLEQGVVSRARASTRTRGPETWDELLHAAARLSRSRGVKGFGAERRRALRPLQEVHALRLGERRRDPHRRHDAARPSIRRPTPRRSPSTCGSPSTR